MTRLRYPFAEIGLRCRLSQEPLSKSPVLPVWDLHAFPFARSRPMHSLYQGAF